MKTPLKISILLNLSLLAGLIVLLADRSEQVAVPAPLAVHNNPNPPPETVVVTQPRAVPPEPPPFRWSQLEAKDYHVYVKKLRAVGCPEPTVRAIVTADVDSVYQLIANQLEAKLSAANSASWPQQLSAFSSEAELRTALQKLPDVETAKINDLLGLPVDAPPAEAAMASTAQTSAGDGQSPAANRRMVGLTAKSKAGSADGVPGLVLAADESTPLAAASQMANDIQLPPLPNSAGLPLVFQPMDPAAASLSPSQTQVVNELRQEFATALQGSSQDPADPAYQRAWQQALTQSDRLLEANLGQNAFNQYWDAQWDAQHQPSLAN